MHAASRPRPVVLLCPQCREEQEALNVFGDPRETVQRIGNRKSRCPMCNRFAQKVRRRAYAALAKKYRADFDDLWVRAEVEVYRELVEQIKKEQMQ